MTLGSIANELNVGRPVPQVYDGSQVEQLVQAVATLTNKEQSSLKSALQSRRKTDYRALLKKSRIWLWSGEIEDVLIRNTQCEDAVENTLVTMGRLPGVIGNNRGETLRGILHNSGHEPDVLQTVVERLEADKLFSRSEVNLAMTVFMEGMLI